MEKISKEGRDSGVKARQDELAKCKNKPGMTGKMDHLVCFMPGTILLSITGGKRLKVDELDDVGREDLSIATRLLNTCHHAYSSTATGLAPEIVQFTQRGQEKDVSRMLI
jgi:hypothetical protein